MKFVFASYVYTPGVNDPAIWVKKIDFYTGILEALAKNNVVINIGQIDYEGEYLKGGVKYYFKRFRKSGLRFPLKLHRFIKALEPDIVVIQSLHFPLQVIQLRLLLGKQARIIVQNHAEQPFKGIKKYLQRIADTCIDAYLFTSHEMGMDWLNKGNMAKPDKIREVMEVSSVFTPMNKLLARKKMTVTGDPVFLWVGRLNHNKDPLTVVRAFLRFAALHTAACLYMIYHTAELLPDILKLLNNSPYKDSVILVGSVPHTDMQYWFNSADIILSGSFYEGSGTAVCEAMSCGCMPLVTDISSFRMITANGRCGLLYEPGNEDALLSALICTQQMDIREKQKISYDQFRVNLSFEAIAGRFEAVAASL